MNIESVVELKPNPNIPDITSGDTVRVSVRVVEGDKERTQVFQGVVLKIRKRGAGSSFTVRRVAYGVGVERTFPFYSPRVEKVELVRRGKKRRAKLYYLRGLSARTSRLKEKRLTPKEMEREQERLERLAQAAAQGVGEGQEIELEDAPELQAPAEDEQELEAAAELGAAAEGAPAAKEPKAAAGDTAPEPEAAEKKE